MAQTSTYQPLVQTQTKTKTDISNLTLLSLMIATATVALGVFSGLAAVTLVNLIVSTTNLVSYWNFDNVESNVLVRDQVGVNDALIFNAPTLSTTTTNAIKGAAFILDGNDFGKIVDNSSQSDNPKGKTNSNSNTNSGTKVFSLDITGDITISAWVKRTSDSGYAGIINKWAWTKNGVAVNDRSYELVIDSNNKFAMVVSKNGTDAGMTKVNSNSPVVNGQWYHVAGVLSGSNLLLYVNGVKQTDSKTFTGGIYAGQANVIFGAFNEGDLYRLKGLMDEVRIYKRALSDEEIRNLAAICGDSIIEIGEQCDDGNTVNGDGCSSTCQYSCSDTDVTSSFPDGKNYYLKGTVNGWSNQPPDLVTFSDCCIQSSDPNRQCVSTGDTLVERICDSYWNSFEYYQCPDGCSDGACNAAIIPRLKISASMTNPPPQQVMAGTRDHIFANIILDATDSGEDIKVNNLAVSVDCDANCAPSDTSDWRIFEGGNQLATINDPDSDIVTKTTNGSNATATFMLTSPPFLVIPKGTSKTITVKANIAFAVTAGTMFAGMADLGGGNVYAVGKDSANPAQVTLIPNNGQGQTFISVVCTDSDGGIAGIQEFIHGTTTGIDSGGSLVEEPDRCTIYQISTSTNPLIEYYCNNSIVTSTNVNCVHGCKDGKCICRDDDGGFDLYEKTSCIDTNGDFEKCNSGIMHERYYIRVEDYYYFDYLCKYGCKDNGTCNTPPRPSCYETDNGDDIYNRGVVEANRNELGYPRSAIDNCTDQDRQVFEYWCAPDGSGAIWQGSKMCPDGCSDGACNAAIIP